MPRHSLRSRWRLCRLTDAACPLRVVSAMQIGNNHGTIQWRNANSGTFTILTMACTIGKCVAGSGMPLPYNGVCGRRSATKPTSLQGGR